MIRYLPANHLFPLLLSVPIRPEVFQYPVNIAVSISHISFFFFPFVKTENLSYIIGAGRGDLDWDS